VSDEAELIFACRNMSVRINRWLSSTASKQV